ncbi:MAG: ABC transporter permease [Acholeplasmataceae bacterium]|jgi:simple sugar transport system permease protein
MKIKKQQIIDYWNKLKETDGFKAFLGSMLAISMGLFLGIVLMIFVNPSNSLQGIGRLLMGMFNNPRGGWIGLGQLLYRATPLFFTGLAVAFAFKTGLFNIGASGQYTMGIFIAALIGILGDSLGSFQWILAVLGGMLGGFVWGFIPGFFKAKFNVHEVITSIMFNYIGVFLVNGILTSNYLRNEMVDLQRTAKIDQAARTPYGFFDTMFPNTGLDISIFIAIGTAIILYIVLNKTVFGRELKSVGLNRDASKYAGINEKRSIMLSMAISGMIAGLGGALFILAPSARNFGNTYSIESVIVAEGFDGIPIALLAASNPIGVIFSTLFIGYISLSGIPMQSVGYVSEIVNMIISIILYFSAFALIMTQNIGKIKNLFKKRIKKKPSDQVDVKAGDL